MAKSEAMIVFSYFRNGARPTARVVYEGDDGRCMGGGRDLEESLDGPRLPTQDVTIPTIPSRHTHLSP